MLRRDDLRGWDCNDAGTELSLRGASLWCRDHFSSTSDIRSVQNDSVLLLLWQQTSRLLHLLFALRSQLQWCLTLTFLVK